MENHMEEVAKLLGLELYEEFTVPEYDQGNYQFRKEGLCVLRNGFWDDNFNRSFLLECLLLGKYEIAKSPWKPKINDLYYFVDPDGFIVDEHNTVAIFDRNMLKLGNCYKTRELAEANKDKWIQFYKSDEVLEVK